jgi:bifunctional non-homologous end joining protein LigD
MDPFPDILLPMLPTSADYPPEGNEWLHEIRYEGYRLLCRIDGRDIRFQTLDMRDWTRKLPSLVDSLREVVGLRAWLDGELVFTETDGRPCFGSLRDSVRRGRHHCLSYWVFDLMCRDDNDIRELPLLVRKQMLAEVLPDAPNIRKVDHILGRGADVFRGACRMGAEGIVSKKAMSCYVSGRTTDWLETKCPGRHRIRRGAWEEWS